MRTALLLVALALVAPTALAIDFGLAEDCGDPATEAECGGIRPGGSLGGFCTLAWALRSGEDVYMTTAGHCVSVGQRASTTGIGQWGTVVMSVCGATPLFETCEPGYDYALIKVDESKEALVSNRLCGWAAPVAVFEARDVIPRVVKHHGFGLGTGTLDATRARAGVSFLMDDARKFGFWGAASFGDSGSAAMIEGTDGIPYALGIITHIVAYTEADPDPARDGTVTGTRLDVVIPEANAALGLDLRLL